MDYCSALILTTVNPYGIEMLAQVLGPLHVLEMTKSILEHPTIKSMLWILKAESRDG